MKQWEAPALRQGFDHRGHQCNACGMLPHAGAAARQAQGRDRRRAGVRGLVGAGWTTVGAGRPAVSWLNTQIDRACVDVNEFGWLCGWVMECQEGPHHRAAAGFRLAWGDAEARRAALDAEPARGFGDVLAEGTARRRAPRRRRGGVRDLHGQERLAPRPRSPRALGGDARHLHGLDGHPRDGAGGVPRPSWGCPPASTRSTPSRSRARSPGSAGAGTSRTRSARASSRRGPSSRT